MEKTKYDGNKVVSWNDVGWKPAEIKVPAEILKFSEAIRAGLSMMGETHVFYIPDNNCGCAVFTGAVAGGYEKKYRGDSHLFDFVVGRFGVPRETVLKASQLHYERKLDRAGIADWLAAQGY